MALNALVLLLREPHALLAVLQLGQGLGIELRVVDGDVDGDAATEHHGEEATRPRGIVQQIAAVGGAPERCQAGTALHPAVVRGTQTDVLQLDEVLQECHAAATVVVELIEADEGIGGHAAQALLFAAQRERVGEERVELRRQQMAQELALAPPLLTADEDGAELVAVVQPAAAHLRHRGDERPVQDGKFEVVVGEEGEERIDAIGAVPDGQRVEVGGDGVVGLHAAVVDGSVELRHRQRGQPRLGQLQHQRALARGVEGLEEERAAATDGTRGHLQPARETVAAQHMAGIDETLGADDGVERLVAPYGGGRRGGAAGGADGGAIVSGIDHDFRALGVTCTGVSGPKAVQRYEERNLISIDHFLGKMFGRTDNNHYLCRGIAGQTNMLKQLVQHVCKSGPTCCIDCDNMFAQGKRIKL